MRLGWMLLLGIGIMIGLTLGLFIVARPTVIDDAPNRLPAGDASRDPDAPRQPDVLPSRITREAVSPSGSSLFSPALLDHYRKEFAEEWSRHRADQPEASLLQEKEGVFRRSTLALPASLARGAAEDRSEDESWEAALAAGDGISILELLDRHRLEDPDDRLEIVDACVQNRGTSATLDGRQFAADRDQKIRQGLTLYFGPGRHQLEERRLRGPDQEAFPTDVTILGAGKTSTLLIISDISIRGHVERLTIRGLTLFTEHDGLFDLRSGSAILEFDDVRVIGFDAAHGGATIFSTDGLMIRAMNSDFLGGYGRSPGRGDLFRHGPLVGRFSQCRFELIERLGFSNVGRGKLVFAGCSFGLMADDLLNWRARSNIVFSGCSFEPPLSRGVDRDTLQKSVDDLFPP